MRRLLFSLLYLDTGLSGLQVEDKCDFPKKLAKWEAGEPIGHQPKLQTQGVSEPSGHCVLLAHLAWSPPSHTHRVSECGVGLYLESQNRPMVK